MSICHGKSIVFSKKDFGIITSTFFLTFISCFFFLWNNGIYLQRLHLTMQVLGVIICIMLGLNVSFFVYKLLTNPEKMILLLKSMQESNVLRRTVIELVFLNLVVLLNFAFLTFSYIIETRVVQILAVSLSVGTWPLFFLILLNMDGRFKVKQKSYRPMEMNVPIAMPCGPAIMPVHLSPPEENKGATPC